jgi:hypothetical protein
MRIELTMQRLMDGRFEDMPGGGQFHDDHAARSAAVLYTASSGQRSRLVDANGDPVWDSKFDMPTYPNWESNLANTER